MQADHPYSDDLSDLEDRLRSWKPGVDRLDADRMLYAAGRAAIARGKTRFVWPALTGVLATLVVVLSVRISVEHAELVTLLSRPTQASPLMPAVGPETVSSPSADSLAATDPLACASLLAGRRALQTDADAWRCPEPPASSEPVFSGRPVLQAWQSERVFEP